MLSGNHHCVDSDRLSCFVILDRYLRFAVGKDVGEGAIFSLLCEAIRHSVCQRNRQGHQIVGLVAGITEHHALVSCAANLIVGSHRNVGALLINGGEHRAGVTIEACFGAVVADVLQRLSDDAGNVDVALGCDLAHDYDHAGRAAGLTGDSSIGILTHDLVEDCVGDLVTHLVGVSLCDRFRSEKNFAHFNLQFSSCARTSEKNLYFRPFKVSFLVSCVFRCFDSLQYSTGKR